MDRIKSDGADEWVLIYSASNQQTAEIIKQVLGENEIVAVVMNRKDSMYPSIGEVDVFALSKNSETAKKLISNLEF